MLEIPITPFELKLPNVNTLGIKLIGNPFKNEEGEDVQTILQILKDDEGVVRESKNRDVPVAIAELVIKFTTGTITTEEKAFATQFAKTFNENINIL